MGCPLLPGGAPGGGPAAAAATAAADETADETGGVEEAAAVEDGEDEVDEEDGSSEAKVEEGRGELPWACAAARSAFIELMGSLGSSAEAGIPAA